MSEYSPTAETATSGPDEMSRRSLHIVHTEASCGWGGQEIRILEESRGMLARGHRITLLCPPEATIFKRAAHWGVEVIGLPIRKKRLADLQAMRRWLRQHRGDVDVINTHSSTDSWLAAMANLTSGGTPVPLVRTRHISAPVANSLANRWLYGKAVVEVVTTGETLRRELIKGLHLSAEHVESIFTGIDTARFEPGDKASARQRVGLEEGLTWVGIVATIRTWKGHQYLLEAIAALGDPHVRLAIVGDGPHRATLEKRVTELGLQHTVRFVGNQQDVVPWLQALDVFVLPSYANEGVSQAVMQAMSAGLPVITTAVGSMTDVIKADQTGILVPPRDPSAIAGALRRLIDTPADAMRLGQQARAFALEHCGIESMVTRMETVFLRAAGFSKP